MSRARHTALLALALCAGAATAQARGDAAASAPSGTDAASQRVVDQGIAVRFVAEAPARPGEAMGFRFELRDTASNAPLSGLRPAAWLAPHAVGARPVPCAGQVARYLGADLFNRADVDLNTYFVLSLDDGPSISVVDPLFGFGGSKLLTLLPLESPGRDWAALRDRLFVTQDAAAKVAVADTRQWKIEKQIATGAHPGRVIVAANRAWIADAQGVTVVDAGTLVATRLKLGAVRDLVANADGDRVFAAAGRRVVAIDAYAARVVAETTLDATPTQLDYSRAGQAVYALDAAAGRVLALESGSLKARSDVAIKPGSTQLRFAPDGRHALLPNPSENLVQVLDAASDRIVQNLDLPGAPEAVTYTDLLAYVRLRQGETVPMIALAQIGAEHQGVGAAEFPSGQHALGAAQSLADAIVDAPDHPGVLVANAADRMIYLYKEGMAAPAGGFSTYGRVPRAVRVVDHGLRETARGDYATAVPLPRGGRYDVTFFVDAPRVVACFTADIGGPAAPEKPVPRVVALDPPAHLARGQAAHLRFAIHEIGPAPAQQSAPKADDVRGLAFEAPGVWQRRGDARRLADGSYEFDFVPPEAGTYYVWLESASLGLSRDNGQFQVYEVD